MGLFVTDNSEFDFTKLHNAQLLKFSRCRGVLLNRLPCLIKPMRVSECTDQPLTPFESLILTGGAFPPLFISMKESIADALQSNSVAAHHHCTSFGANFPTFSPCNDAACWCIFSGSGLAPILFQLLYRFDVRGRQSLHVIPHRNRQGRVPHQGLNDLILDALFVESCREAAAKSMPAVPLDAARG